MKTENEASRKACEMLRKIHLTESEIIVGAFDDDFIIERYKDEWSAFMDGWYEAMRHVEQIMLSDNPYLLTGDELKKAVDVRKSGKPF